jgi:hypothetical protein
VDRSKRKKQVEQVISEGEPIEVIVESKRRVYEGRRNSLGEKQDQYE